MAWTPNTDGIQVRKELNEAYGIWTVHHNLEKKNKKKNQASIFKK